MSSIITQNVSESSRFQLKKNTKFDKVSSDSITLLKNTPVAVSYVRRPFQLGGTTQMNFEHTISEKNYLDRGVRLEMTIPITLKRAGTAPAAAPTNDTYLEWLGDFSQISLRQYGLIQTIDSMRLQFDSSVITNMTNVPKILESTSEYYDDQEIDYHFQASQPDRFTNYNYYASKGTKPENRQIKTVNENGITISIPRTNLDQENIFTGGYTNDYNSRKPVFEFVSAETDRLTAHFRMKLFSFIPFTVFDLPGDSNSIYGVKTMSTNITMKPDWISRLFSVSQKMTVDSAGAETWEDVWESITFNNADAKSHSASLELKVYSPPDYITKAITDPTTGGVLPYAVNMGSIVMYPQSQIPNSAAGNFVLNDITLPTVPKAIYLSLNAVPDLAKPWSTPNYKARLKSLDIRYNNVTTTITNPLTLYNIGKANGLNKDYESAMLTNGYVLKLDMSKDIGTGGLLVGSNNSCSLSISGTFDNLCESAKIPAYEVRLVAANEGSLVYGNGVFKVNNSLVILNPNLDLNNQAAELYDLTTEYTNMIGGGIGSVIWGGIKRFAQKGVKYVRDNPEQVGKFLANAAKTVVGGQYQHMHNVTGGSGPVSFSTGAGSVSTMKYK